MGGMIVAPQPDAVEEGAKVLMEGGNAIDAAVTCAFVQGVIDPQMCGIGGFGMLHIYHAATRESEFLDFPGRAGSRTTPEMWKELVVFEAPDGFGYYLEGKVNDIGYTSIAVPGTVRGLHEALTRLGSGRFSWFQLMQPAIRLAQEGFMVSAELAATWRRKTEEWRPSMLERLQSNAETRRIYLKSDGNPYDEGDVIRNEDLARTLQLLAKEGAEVFYMGEVAKRIVEDLANNGGFVTLPDLSNYQAILTKPVIGSYRGYTVASSPPPGGGVTLLQILSILESYELSRLEHNSPDYIYLLSQAMKAAFADRANFIGDPTFGEVPMEWLLSKERAADWRRKIDAGEPIIIPRIQPREPEQTTHISVVDSEGNCVALTHSLGSSSGVITPGLGFIYNNSMVCFNPIPGHVNSIQPGKARVSGMAPTIVFKNGKPFFIVGAPGGSRIITGVLQAILNVIDFGMSVIEAVAAPRFDCQGEVIECHARIPEFVCEQIRRRGQEVRRLPRSYGGMALVHGILIDEQTEIPQGGADPGGGGMALSV